MTQAHSSKTAYMTVALETFSCSFMLFSNVNIFCNLAFTTAVVVCINHVLHRHVLAIVNIEYVERMAHV